MFECEALERRKLGKKEEEVVEELQNYWRRKTCGEMEQVEL